MTTVSTSYGSDESDNNRFGHGTLAAYPSVSSSEGGGSNGALSDDEDVVSVSSWDSSAPSDLELAQAADQAKVKTAVRSPCGKNIICPFGGDGSQMSEFVSHETLSDPHFRPKHLPGLAFKAEELWQLRKAFDMFANKYRATPVDPCGNDGRGRRTTEDWKAHQIANPNASQPTTFSLRSFELATQKKEEETAAAEAMKHTPILPQIALQSDATELSANPVVVANGDEETGGVVSKPQRSMTQVLDEDLIRMSDYSYCFASWTGLMSCQTCLNVHLYWNCNQVALSSAGTNPTITFSMFVKGFADYCFADKVSHDTCLDPRVRRKRLFRSLTAEVFESLKQDATYRFQTVLAFQEFCAIMFPPLNVLRRAFHFKLQTIPCMPPFESPFKYMIWLTIIWFFSTIFPLTLPQMDPNYEKYTSSNKLCEIETFGLVALYIFLAILWSVMCGSNYREHDWETHMKRDLDWLSLIKVKSPLACVTRVRSAKDIFERLFIQVYLIGKGKEVPLKFARGIDHSGGINKRKRSFRSLQLSTMSWTRCVVMMGLAFVVSCPIAFLPTLYRAAVAHVEVIPIGESVPILIVVNYMIVATMLTMMKVNLNFITYTSYVDFGETLCYFNYLFCLSRCQKAKDNLPFLPLNNPENIRSWAMMRRYLLEIHMHQKIRPFENVYGILFLTVIGGLLFVIIRELMSNTTYASSLLVMYVAVLFAVQLLAMIFKGVDINEAQASHTSLLADQGWEITRVLLSFSQKCDGTEKTRLAKSEHLLTQLAHTIRHSRTVLCIWGIPLQANFRNAVLTVTFSACSSALSYWLRNSN